MDTETTISSEPSHNPVSVYRADGPMDDFPVLKAFQQYIDAEQNKARKRLLSLCVAFGAMMCIIIAVFMVMLHDISQRNQTLNDRLVEYAMKDRDRAPVMVQQPVAAAPVSTAATEAALKAMTETLITLQKQLSERQSSSAVEVDNTASNALSPSIAESEIARKEKLARERIRKERAQLAEERRKFAEERERRHQEEVERHRRRLYPEYYANQDNPKAGTSGEVRAPVATQPKQQMQPAKREISDDDIADILREANLSDEYDDVPEAVNQAPEPVKAAAAPVAEEPAAPRANASATGKDRQTPLAKPTPEKTNDDVVDAIEYFSDSEYEIPVEVKGSSAKWRVPLD